ncbi:MAG: ribosome maturation factor RimP [Gammaproteobacteria bacterium]|nr:MAG: ribosome maturation factor RimP [Gammaproteobacteria bacterium]RTZ73618.1 MAG: ribosome maturation factor RimP [Gammaproteobacteria bacterium]RTZ77086.1 MAG: ribosome maturation factor RimP [Gammaproteobacteria bacterium]
MQKSPKAIEELVRGVVEAMGYELVGVQYLTGQPGGNVLRVYIDKEGGVQLDDCTAVSHQLSGVLDVEDPIPGNYNLEISSPGLDRPLFEPAHYQRYIGQQVNIRLDPSIGGRRKYKGTLLGIEGRTIQVEVDGEVYSLDLDDIRDARLVPQI